MLYLQKTHRDISYHLEINHNKQFLQILFFFKFSANLPTNQKFIFFNERAYKMRFICKKPHLVTSYRLEINYNKRFLQILIFANLVRIYQLIKNLTFLLEGYIKCALHAKNRTSISLTV